MILITGATGLLGSYIARYLVSEGRAVRGLRRKTSDMSLLAGADKAMEWTEGDVLDVVALEEAMQDVTHVIHSAAVVTFLAAKKPYMMQVNIEGTANVVNVALDMGVQRLLYISSVAALGKGKPDTVLHEDIEWEESPYDSGYGLSKYLAEMEVWRGMVEGLNAAIINPSTILGAGRWSDSSTRIFSKVEEGISFYPTGSNGYVDVRDVAKIAIQVLDSNIANTRLIVSAENLKYQQLIGHIADALGRKHPTIPVKGVLQTAAWMAEGVRSFLTGTEPVITREVATLTAQNYLYSHNRLLDHLDVRFTPIEQTIKETVAKLQESRKSGQDFAVFEV